MTQRFGLELTPEDASSMEALKTPLRQNPGLQNSLRVNPPENARLSFEQIARDQLHDMVERNFARSITQPPSQRSSPLLSFSRSCDVGRLNLFELCRPI